MLRCGALCSSASMPTPGFKTVSDVEFRNLLTMLCLAGLLLTTGERAGERAVGWDTFFKYKNVGATDMWTEHLQILHQSDGRYDLRVHNRTTAPDHDQFWIEWVAEKPIKACGLLEVLIEAMRARGLRTEIAIQAAIAVRGELPIDDATEVERSLAALLTEQPSLIDWLKQHHKTAARELEKLIRKQSRIGAD